jgi:hypothetical protein
VNVLIARTIVVTSYGKPCGAQLACSHSLTAFRAQLVRLPGLADMDSGHDLPAPSRRAGFRQLVHHLLMLEARCGLPVPV